MERYSFFDSTDNDNREYTADEFAEYFRNFLTNGIFKGGLNLKVDCKGDTMQTFINQGYAYINGYMYVVDTEPLYLTHDPADVQNDRIDRIVLRLDTSLDKRCIKAIIKKGTPSSSPAFPTLTREGNIYELGLAQIRIIKGKSYIQASQITDERLDNNVCGLVNSIIQADTTQIFNQFQAFLNEKKIEYPKQWESWFNQTSKKYEDDLILFLTSLKNRLSTADVTYLDGRIAGVEGLIREKILNMEILDLMGGI